MPVFIIHCWKRRVCLSTSATLPLLIRWAASSHVKPLWYGCIPQWTQDVLRQVGQLIQPLSFSPTTTRIEQLGVGQARKSGMEATARSKLRESKHSTRGAGKRRRRSRSCTFVVHSGHCTSIWPTAILASVCLLMQSMQ